MKKNRAQKDILYISISSFILVVIWIGFNIYHIQTTTKISQEIQLQLDPIEPTFDYETLNKIKARSKVLPLYELQTSVTPSPEASESAEPIINSVEGE